MSQWLDRVKISDFSTKWFFFCNNKIKEQCAVLESDVSGLELCFWSPR